MSLEHLAKTISERIFMKVFFTKINRLIFRLLVISFVVFTLLGLPAFSSKNTILLAKADTVTTPEGVYYKGIPEQGKITSDQQNENNPRYFQDRSKNIREKLNLDEPVPESTKDFFEDIRTNVGKTLEPITGSKNGYYQENIPPEKILRDKR
jgi:hypothetical protein